MMLDDDRNPPSLELGDLESGSAVEEESKRILK